ncbi:MAG TPA: hypothetical protein VFU23_02745 [Gemmatimonadales bacterium]|nr:hypothetical protein [Gemmatimonadales bacterium]
MRRLSVPLLLLAACGSPTESNHPTLRFENGVVFGIPTLPITAVPGSGSIIVSGVIQTVTGGFSLFGDLRAGPGNALTVRVDVYLTGPGFNFVTQNFYRASVGSLPPGDYDVSVIHVLHDPSPARTQQAFHGTVHVE